MTIPIKRVLKPPTRSFFLFGPRGVGKSTWIKNSLKAIVMIDLLRSDMQLKLGSHPEYLESIIGDIPENSWVCIDEVQKVPALLDEVQRIMENRKINFALCGSSARALKRTGVNLLGGRAISIHMEPFSFEELGEKFDLDFSLSFGLLPLVVNDRENAKEILSTYVHTYIKEEIREEGVVRRMEPFLRFLEIAGLLNGQKLNSSNIAREAHISRGSVDNYFSVLTDTLLGHFLPAYRPFAKVREAALPKFYWVDPGIGRACANMLYDPLDSVSKGIALETLIFHELRVYNHYSKKNRPIGFYKTPDKIEIDFIIEIVKKMQKAPPVLVCIEVKSSKKWDRRWEKPIRLLKEKEGVIVKGMVGIYAGRQRVTFDDFTVFPVVDFLTCLHSGKIF